MNGAEATAAALRREGVEHVFGLPGTTVMHLIDAFARTEGLRFVSVRHEQVAAFMADGFARASGKVGVCLASRGPGAANLAIGVHNAHAESVPVLALVGQVPDAVYYRDSFEEMDLLRFFEPMTKWATEIHRVDRVPELVQRAVRTAMSGRPGPVLASLPLDVQVDKHEPVLQPAHRAGHPAPAPSSVDDALRLLADARRPVAILGGGMQGTTFDADLLDLVDRMRIPVVTTWMRKNVFPNDSDLFCGSLGYGALPLTEELVRSADVVLALGCKFSEFTTKSWTLLPDDVRLIHVDVAEEVLGRVYVPEVGIHADAHHTVVALAAAARASEGRPDQPTMEARTKRAEWARSSYLQQARLPDVSSRSGVSSADVVRALGSVLSETPAVLIQDAPSLGTWIQRYLDFTTPGSFYAAGGGSMGWGMPAAMGMQLARPGERIVAVCGDGSFWMVAQDLETAVRENLPVVTVVNNNYSYGNTRDRQRVAHGGRYSGVFYGNPDFAEFARLVGAHGERVEHARELAPAIHRALDSGKPAVVDVIQDVHEGLPPDLVPIPATTT